MQASGDLTYLVTYHCPRCQSRLEAKVGLIPGWRRCPSCGRASLPPEHVPVRPGPALSKDVLVIGDFDIVPDRAPVPAPNGITYHDPIFRSTMPTPIPRGAQMEGARGRMILGGLFFLCTVLFVFSALSQDGLRSVIFGLGAVVLLMLLARPARRRL